ncbi:pentapeptide repeat-containing protein [Pseudooceanicola sp.]|uniref:pentapeptide repeat-containing protein n=1 Tax=Pseudooceanicola sp. TaxID=1914328 RepID=UPI003513DD06
MLPSTRRSKNHWEPFYDPEDEEAFSIGEWPGDEQSYSRKVFYAKLAPEHTNYMIVDKAFSFCDFDGDFERDFAGSSITFKRCTFTSCDFRSSILSKVKFSDCKFCCTSFSQCRLLDCIFSRCTYDSIYASGGGTEIKDTTIDNPEHFVEAITVNVKNVPHFVSIRFQTLKINETKSVMARLLLANLRNEGSNESFFEAIKTSSISDCKWKIASAKIEIDRLKEEGKIWAPSMLKQWLYLTGGLADEYFLRSAGALNARGSSLSRTMAAGVGFSVAFSLVYFLVFNQSASEAFTRATEVLLLFGYTNHVDKSVNDIEEGIIFINACVGVFWYLIAAPTLVNKLTRVRN